MKCPPILISLKFNSKADEDGRRFVLRVPLFIIVPVALLILSVLFLIALPFLIISLILTWQVGWWRWLIFGIPAFFKTMYALSGLQVDLENRKQKIYIAIH